MFRLLAGLAIIFSLLVSTAEANKKPLWETRKMGVLVNVDQPKKPGTVNPALSEIASWLAQKPVTVRCLTADEAANDSTVVIYGAQAYVPLDFGKPASYTVVAPPVCDVLDKLLLGDVYSERGGVMAWSVMVITHESGHLRGSLFPEWWDEGNVNCWAVRRATSVAQLKFNIQPNQVQFFRSLVRYIYSLQPKGYRPSACNIP